MKSLQIFLKFSSFVDSYMYCCWYLKLIRTYDIGQLIHWVNECHLFRKTIHHCFINFSKLSQGNFFNFIVWAITQHVRAILLAAICSRGQPQSWHLLTIYWRPSAHSFFLNKSWHCYTNTWQTAGFEILL